MQNVSREMKRGYPDRRRLEAQCISCVTFVRSEAEVLDSPVWVMLINVVAMELLKSKMPPGERGNSLPSLPQPVLTHKSWILGIEM